MLASTLVGALLALLTALPLAWKWRLGVRRTALGVVLMALLSGLLVSLMSHIWPIIAHLQAGVVWLMTLAAALAVLAYRFYRDPERTIPDRGDVIVSPADGEVLYVRIVRDGMLPVATKDGREYSLQELIKTPLCSERAVVIGIGMSFLDVHVNRAPIAGRVIFHRHFPGRFGSLRRPEMALENERATTIIARDELQVAVVQIASRLVRQITSFICEGQDVALGQRIGVIRFGSQVDLVLPAHPDLRLLVQPHERVTAGRSIMATVGLSQ